VTPEWGNKAAQRPTAPDRGRSVKRAGSASATILRRFGRIIATGGKLLQFTLEDFPTFRIEFGPIVPKAFFNRSMIRDVPGAETKNIRRAGGPLSLGALLLLGTN
jgi:hypothetical protein